MFYYLATPYSKYPRGTGAAYIEACQQAALLVQAKIPVFCPIAHSHGVAVLGGVPLDSYDIWLPADAPFMEAACGLIVCEMEGWETSYGISEEIKAFRAAGKPIVHMTPGVVPELPAADPLMPFRVSAHLDHADVFGVRVPRPDAIPPAQWEAFWMDATKAAERVMG